MGENDPHATMIKGVLDSSMLLLGGEEPDTGKTVHGISMSSNGALL